MTSVGFIGLGTMGGPMARNIVKKGHALTVFDVDPKAVAALVADGARAAATPREVAAASEVVITMLPDAPDVERVASGPDGILAGLKSGSVYIDMSTIDPETSRRVGAAVRKQGSDMVDSPVGKTAEHAVSGTLTLMVGGERRRWRACGRCSTAWAPTSSIAANSAPDTR
jgi:4-hydroxybutyrate dehydrogenase / sulfolactaldehyde 3-reductase